ncbi:MAG: DUF6291 domain-containing protein [Clostridia bacterium]|nr:DUF6291 domain-containing protein [Clostridia bacterium]
MENKQNIKQNSGNITSFFFYEDYAAAVTELTDKDAGEFIKLFGAYIFDKKQTKTTDSKAAKLFTLLSLDVNTTAKQASKNRKHFTFYRQYHEVFSTLEDEVAGSLIKKVCGYMFDTEYQTENENSEANTYFNAMKVTLSKSKNKAANATKKEITIETILKDFPQILGSLRMDNPILNEVNMNKLYKYIEEHTEMQTERIYNIVVNFRRDNGLPEVQK